MKIKKLVTTLFMVFALAAMSVIPAFAASNVSMYAYNEDEDAYVSSAHADDCVASCTDNGDGSYNLVFKVISNSGATGYLSEFNGKAVSYNSTAVGSLSKGITFYPTNDVDINGEIGSQVSFTVTVKMGSMAINHPYANGAIVIR